MNLQYRVNLGPMKRARAVATDEMEGLLAVLGAMRGGDPAMLMHCFTGGGVLPKEMADAVADILGRSVAELFTVEVQPVARAASMLPDAKRGPSVPFKPAGHVGQPLPRGPGRRR